MLSLCSKSQLSDQLSGGMGPSFNAIRGWTHLCWLLFFPFPWNDNIDSDLLVDLDPTAFPAMPAEMPRVDLDQHAPTPATKTPDDNNIVMAANAAAANADIDNPGPPEPIHMPYAIPADLVGKVASMMSTCCKVGQMLKNFETDMSIYNTSYQRFLLCRAYQMMIWRKNWPFHFSFFIAFYMQCQQI